MRMLLFVFVAKACTHQVATVCRIMLEKKGKKLWKNRFNSQPRPLFCPASSHFQKTNLWVCKCDICSQLLLLCQQRLEVVSWEAGEKEENKCVTVKHETPHKEWSVLGNPKRELVLFPYRNQCVHWVSPLMTLSDVNSVVVAKTEFGVKSHHSSAVVVIFIGAPHSGIEHH